MAKHTKCGVLKACKHCGEENCELGGIYTTRKIFNRYHKRLNYFVCKQCFNFRKDIHDLSKIYSSPTHVYGDISGNDFKWMTECRTLTSDGIYPEIRTY